MMVDYCLEHETTACNCPDMVPCPRAALEPDLLRVRKALRYCEAAYQELASLPLGKFDGVFNAALHLKGARDLLTDAQKDLPKPPKPEGPKTVAQSLESS